MKIKIELSLDTREVENEKATRKPPPYPKKIYEYLGIYYISNKKTIKTKGLIHQHQARGVDPVSFGSVDPDPDL